MLAQHGALLMRREKVGVPLVGVDDLDVVHLLGGEVCARQLGSGQELIQGALLRDRAHLHPSRILLFVDEVLLAGSMIRPRDGGCLLSVRALVLAKAIVHQGIAEPDALLGLCQNHGGGSSVAALGVRFSKSTEQIREQMLPGYVKMATETLGIRIKVPENDAECEMSRPLLMNNASGWRGKFSVLAE